jgi:hypothetical protein
MASGWNRWHRQLRTVELGEIVFALQGVVVDLVDTERRSAETKRASTWRPSLFVIGEGLQRGAVANGSIATLGARLVLFGFSTSAGAGGAASRCS